MDDHQTFYVGINIFVISKEKLLLGKRKGAYGSKSWGLPGGHLEHKESMDQNAARELMEETGMRAERFDFVNLVNDRHHSDRHYIQLGFRAVNVKGEPTVKEPSRCYEW